MATGESSFDVVSQFDRQELVNAVDQALREVRTRFDLKDSGTTIELDDHEVKLHSASEMTLDATRDVLLQKAVRRQLSPKVFAYGRVEEASRGTVRQTATLQQGLSQDLCREITRLLRDQMPKLKTQIRGRRGARDGQEPRRSAGRHCAAEEDGTGPQLACATAVRQLPLTRLRRGGQRDRRGVLTSPCRWSTSMASVLALAGGLCRCRAASGRWARPARAVAASGLRPSAPSAFRTAPAPAPPSWPPHP